MAKDVLGDQGVPALTRIKEEASTLKHDEIAREVVHQAEIVEEEPKKTVEASRPISRQKERGRMFVFKPTGERVTVTKDRVGLSYNGDVIHEVTSREGKVFLASTRQLKDLV